MKKQIQQLTTITLTILFCLLSFVFCLPSVKAADEPVVNLALSPAIQYIHIEKGESQKETITVMNKGGKAVPLRVYAENFEASDMTGGVSFNTDNTKQYSSSTWLRFANPNVVLDPGQSKEVNFTIDCPSDAESGGHYSVIFFEPLNSQQVSDSSNLGVSQRVGALLFITVEGDITEAGMVLGATAKDKCSGMQCSFKTAPFREWGPVPFEFEYKNTGNVHVKVSGNIAIYNLFGQKVAEIPIDEKTVLPGSGRFFEVKWLREPLFNRYRAKLTLSFGTQNATLIAETFFWAIPWRLLLGIAIFVVFTVVYAIFIKKKKTLNNKIIQLSTKKTE